MYSISLIAARVKISVNRLTFRQLKPDLCPMEVVHPAAQVNNGVTKKWPVQEFATRTTATDPSPTVLDPNDTQTISVELSAEDMRAISQPPPVSSSPAGVYRAPLLVTLTLVTACLGVIGYVARASVGPVETDTAASTNVPARAPVPEPAAPAGPPVRFVNPFDRREVFEFPAGTDKQAAHDAVAEILLKRAAERRSRR